MVNIIMMRTAITIMSMVISMGIKKETEDRKNSKRLWAKWD
jgi:hypothetical protein